MSKAILWCSYLLHQLRLLLIKYVLNFCKTEIAPTSVCMQIGQMFHLKTIYSVLTCLKHWMFEVKKWLIIANRKPQEKKLSWTSLRTCQTTFLLVCTSQSYSPAKNLAKTLQSVQITASWEKFLPVLLLNWETFWKMLKSECTNLAYACSGTMQHPQLKQIVLVQRLQ